jgi:hypothetical protein
MAASVILNLLGTSTSASAEPSIGLTYAQIKAEVGHYLGYGRTVTAWTGNQLADVVASIRSGLRQFYWPPAVGGYAHQWTFLRPVTTLSLNGYDDTGTVAVTGSSTTVTLSSGSFPSWLGSGDWLAVAGQVVQISSVAAGPPGVITLASAWTGSTDLTADYQVFDNPNYTLPSNLAYIIGNLSFDGDDKYYGPVQMVGEGMIRSLREEGLDHFGQPQYAALRPVAGTGTTHQRYQLAVWPAPDEDYTLSYQYSVTPEVLTDTTAEYPWGGAVHAETILQSCLSAAEHRMNDERGLQYARYQELLATSIQIDLRNAPATLGIMTDPSMATGRQIDRVRYVTYNGSMP